MIFVTSTYLSRTYEVCPSVHSGRGRGVGGSKIGFCSQCDGKHGRMWGGGVIKFYFFECGGKFKIALR